jgi:uncharacterized radical SAM superfamily protein
MSEVPGIVYRDGKDLIKNPPSPPVANLDNLGIPAHDLVPINLYCEPQMKRYPMSVTMISRGCINSCSYCSACFFNHYRLRSVSNVLEELLWATREIGIKELKFIDDGINYNRKWLSVLLEEMIRKKIDLTWNANVRADCMDYELAVLMKKAGCHTLNIGVESGDQKILNNVRKNTTIELIKSKTKDVKNAGLEWQAYFMLGLPGETKESMKKTLDFALELNPDLVTFNIATPHPGTSFYDYLESNKFLKRVDWDFYDTNSEPVYDYPNLKANEIYAFSLKAYRKFYYRFSYIIKRLKRVSSLKELKNMLRNFYAFSKNYIIKANLKLAMRNIRNKLKQIFKDNQILNNFWTYRITRFLFSYNYIKIQKAILKDLIEQLDKEAVILEIGSGTCENFALLNEKKVIFSDLNYDYLLSAMKFYSSKTKKMIICQDGRFLAVKNSSSDLVIAIGLFHHVDDTAFKEILMQIEGVLKSEDSKLIIIDGLRPTSFGIFNFVGRLLCSLDRGEYFREYSKYRTFLNRSSLRIVKESKIKAFPYELAIFICKKS